MIRGVTSAAAIFAATGVGVVTGTGHPWLALFVAALVVLDLELRYTPVLNRLDAHRYADRMADDADDDSRGGPPG
jgi:putative Mg2+ transporter-C (MgtC) family protein